MSTATRTFEERKIDAQDLYVNTNYHLEDVAKYSGFSVEVIEKFIEVGSWLELKAANQLTKPKIISNLYRKILQLTGDDAVQNAQKIAMLAGAIEKLDKGANASHFIQVFKRFNQYLLEANEIELAKSFNLHQSRFLEKMANNINA